MKFIRPLKEWEREILKSFISCGNLVNSLDNFKGTGVYLFPDGYYWYVKPWNNGIQKYFKGVHSK